MKARSDNKGFTIVELMIATVVFSMVLLLLSLAIVQVGRMFYKGTAINRTQDTARKVTDDIVQAIQFGPSSMSGPVSGAPRLVGTAPNQFTAQSLCIGGIRYSFVDDRSLGGNSAYQAKHVLWKDRTSDPTCPPLDLSRDYDPASSSDGEEMLGENMRAALIDVTPPSDGIWGISVTISYGDQPDLFETGSSFSKCIGTNAGGQFCAVSTISTNAVKRL